MKVGVGKLEEGQMRGPEKTEMHISPTCNGRVISQMTQNKNVF